MLHHNCQWDTSSRTYLHVYVCLCDGLIPVKGEPQHSTMSEIYFKPV